MDLSCFEHVTVCSPIWVFSLAATMRSFCAQAAGMIKEADYILVHHQGSRYENAADEMDRLFCIKRTGLRCVQCRTGKYKMAGAFPCNTGKREI